MASHGSPEGFRLHKKLEQQPCPTCQAAMDRLLDQVRAFQPVARASVAAVAPRPAFSAHQRTLWPKRRAEELATWLAEHPAPEPPPPFSVPATRCAGDESWMPRSPKAVVKKARTAGWWVQVTRAIGPRIDARGEVPEGKERVATIAVAAARGDDRLTWLWHYVLKSGEMKWELDEVFWNREGLIDNDRGKKVLNA